MFCFESGGREIQGLVLAEALQSAYSVDAEPQSWLTAYCENEPAIVAAATVRHHALMAGNFVVVRTCDLPSPAAPPSDGRE
jgi:hypothetical protein